MPQFPRLPQSYLQTPKGYRRPNIQGFRDDVKKLGEEIAEDFKEKVIDNIYTNKYGFSLSTKTVSKKGSSLPFVDDGELVDAIYRDGTQVSVEESPRSDSDLTNKELAMVLEYGTKDKHIPPRPLWRYTYADFRDEAKKRIEEFFKDPQHKGSTKKKRRRKVQ